MFRNARATVLVLCWVAVFAILTSAILTCQGCLPAPSAPTARDPKAQESAAVRVEAGPCQMPDLLGDGSMPPFVLQGEVLGSGVQVDREHVLTAAHVVWCPFLESVRITYQDGYSRAMIVQRVIKEGDVALLEIASAAALPDLPRAAFAPPEAQGYACEATAVPEFGWSCGQLDDVDGDKARDDVASQMTVVHGNSGAGVYDDRGRLIGLTTQLIFCNGTDETGGTCGSRFTSLWKHLAELGL